MTNTYPTPQPEPDDEDAAAMMRPPTDAPSAISGAASGAKPKRRRLRSLFWPGFVVGFLLLSIVSCGGVVLATGINRIDLTTLQNNDQAWTPPLVTATPEVTPVTDEAPTIGEAGGVFAQGQLLANITSSQVNVRAEPGYLSKPAGDIIGQIPPGGRVEVIGGRTVADDLTWWYVRYTAPDGAVIDGWVAEATASGVQILGQ